MNIAPRQGQVFLELVAVMDRLRGPGGCPWDARQTHASLVEYLIEEAYESVEAIESTDSPAMVEELGDLLLQVVFHARIAQDAPGEGWDIDDVCQGIVDKLIRRHPHVFADDQALTPEQVEANWHTQKAREKGRASVTDGIPAALPALTLAAKVNARSQSVARARPTDQVILPDGIDATGLGELLYSLVVQAHELGLDAESALRMRVRQQIEQIRDIETNS